MSVKTFVRRIAKGPRFGQKTPRRRYRGLSLIEAVLSLFIFVLVSDTGIEFMRSAAIALQHRAETARIAVMADLGERFVRRDLSAVLADVGARPNRVRQLSEAELRAAGLLLEGAGLSPVFKRDLELWLYAPTDREVIVIARIFGEIDRPNIPGSVVGVGEIGWVSPLKPTRVQGAGLDWDVSGLQTSTNIPQIGDLVAVRYLNTTADLRPYLHRAPLSIDGVVYNGMAGPLNMGGFDIANVGNVGAASVVTGELSANQLTVTDTLASDQLSVGGSAAITGALSARSGTFAGAVTAASLAASGPLSATRLSVAGPVEAGSAQITGTIAGGSLNVTGLLSSTSLVTGILSSTGVTAGSVQAQTGIIGSNVTANTGVFQSITTGSCTGC